MEKIKNMTKKQKVILASGGVAAFLAIIGAVFVFTKDRSVLRVIANEKIVEYGENVSLELTEYLDLSKLDKVKQDEVKTNTVVTSDIPNEDGKEYPAIGEYDVVLTYKEESETVKVMVKDTTAPRFEKLNEETGEYEAIETVMETYKEVPLTAEDFSVNDLSEVTVGLDESQVDYATAGDYTLKVTATDTSANKSELEVKVTVKEPELTLNSESLEITEGETSKLEATAAGKESTVSFSSSDESIATVNEEGTVTAIKEGTTTIKATANGVEKTCSVTVKAKPVVNKPSNSGSNGFSSGGGNSNSGNNSSSGGSINNGGGSSSNGGSVELSYDYASAKQAFDLQNQKRREAGVPELVWDSTAYEVAKIRAKELTVKMSHKRPNGTTVADGVNGVFYGENIAFGQTSSNMAISDWYASSGHKYNMLNTDYNKGAIARYGNYWVALFTW